GPRVYKVLDSKTAQNDLKDVVAELTESMSEHRYQTGSVSHNFDGLPYGLVGKHPSIIRINEFIQLVSKARYAPCLIRGESGSGKDLCAKLIHQANNIHDDLFFVKDCENSTTYKLLGDLFGVEDDSGVYGPKRKGLLEIYNGGTVVLNNIEKLPPGVQDKLLFYLEERAFKPMGGTRPVVSNVRVIGISQHNLEWFVKHQNFNPDLFYHLNAFEIDLPPLRDRGDDIITLAHFYRQYYNFLFGKSTLSFTPQVEQLLLEYHWPGNVKELKDAIERAVFIANSSQITSKELPGYFKSSTGNDAPGEDFLGNCSMREMERIHIEHVLSFTKGNKSKAASILEISRTTLREKIRQYGISE
ncbi:MAG TPA: sigma-54-dependent Fis family transcriptional regulator, partial [Caldithrix abyssi]|nr:sigma-54-dependent Fis family transcriptional regulator [Caldithrix abyssi]